MIQSFWILSNIHNLANVYLQRVLTTMTKICGHCGNSLIVKAIIVGRGGLTYVPVQGVQYTRALHELEPPLVVVTI